MNEKLLGISIANIASTLANKPPKVLQFMLQSAARELLPNERVAECLRTIVPNALRVEIHKSKSKKTAHYRNLLVCGRVWHCPVCASKISEVRRQELSKATNSWTGGLALITYTISHSNAISLSLVLEKELEAYRNFKAGRIFLEIREYFGWNGSVKSLEITHGKNGWHPHIHELVFLTNVLTEGQFGSLEVQVSRRWRECLKNIGAYASTERGVTVKKSNEDVSDYVAKFGETKIRKDWTFAHELTKQVVKKGRYDGKTPTQLLYDYMCGDGTAGELWLEYAMTLKGRHQLVWSRGMRNMLKLKAEQADEEIAEKIPDDSYLLASLTRGQWRDVITHDAVGEILHAAESQSEGDFAAWLSTTLALWQDA
jgi:hypothetical protein